MEHFNKPALAILFTLLCVCGTTNAQENIQTIWDGQANFIQHSLAEFSGEEYIIAGTVTPGPVSGASDILVLKVHNNGTIIWSHYVDYGRDEFAGSVTVDAQENIVLTGYTGDNGSPNKLLIIVKLDGNGNLLADMVAHDASLNYGLYGFDIVQAGIVGEERDYIVVGTGVQNATEAAPKYAFVMRVDQQLNNIQWSRIYRSNLGQIPPALTTKYDSFNHILKVDHPTLGETYLLTGSGVIPSGNRQMVANDLIDPAGLSQWIDPIVNPQGSLGYRPGNSQYDHTGVMALYSENADEFYVLQPSIETMPGVLKLDGASGTLLDSYFMHNHTILDYNNLITGMAWSDPGKDEIVFSGYHIDPDLSQGFPILFKWHIDDNLTYWNKYMDFFHGVDFYNIPFDFIVKPLNRTGPHSGMHNAIYYQPKALVKIDDLGYRFVAPGQKGAFYSLDLLRTDLNGNIAQCQEDSMGSVNSGIIPQYTNFGSTAFTFQVLNIPIEVTLAELSEDIVCASEPQVMPFMGINKNIDYKRIRLYPNPTSDFVFVSGLSRMENATTTLYDLQGRTVWLRSFGSVQNDIPVSLDVSTLENGVYFVKVSSNGKVVFTERVVVE